MLSGTRIDVEFGAGWKRKWLKVSVDLKFPEALSLVIIPIAHTISLGQSVRLLLQCEPTPSWLTFALNILTDASPRRDLINTRERPVSTRRISISTSDSSIRTDQVCVLTWGLHKVDQSIQLATFMLFSLFVRYQW